MIIYVMECLINELYPIESQDASRASWLFWIKGGFGKSCYFVAMPSGNFRR